MAFFCRCLPKPCRFFFVITLLFGIACCFAASPHQAHAAPSRHVRIYLQWQPQAQFAGFIMGRVKNYFKDEGLEVQYVWASLGDSPLAALISGDVQFASAWITPALALRAQGVPLVNVFQGHQRSGSLLVVRKDIATPGDLNGQIIQSWGGDFRLELDMFLRANGITPARILPLPTSLAAFINGLVAGTQAMEYNEYYKLMERGMKRDDMRVFALADYGVNLLGDGLYVTQAYLEEHPDIVRGVCKALRRGWAYAFAHEDETVNTLMAYAESKKTRTNATHQRTMLRTIKKHMTHRVGENPEQWGTLHPDDFEHARRLLMDYGYNLAGLQFNQFFVQP